MNKALLIGMLLGMFASVGIFSLTDVYFHEARITRVIEGELPAFEFQSALYLYNWPIKKFTITTQDPSNFSVRQGWGYE